MTLTISAAVIVPDSLASNIFAVFDADESGTITAAERTKVITQLDTSLRESPVFWKANGNGFGRILLLFWNGKCSGTGSDGMCFGTGTGSGGFFY